MNRLQMLQNNNKYRILKIFIFNPTTKFGLREISRLVNLGLPSVRRYILDLVSEGLIRKEDFKGNPFYIAEIDSEKFRNYSIISFQYELFESGVIEYIWNRVSPKSIIFYGSARKGESIEDSDIDLFVIGRKIDLDLKKYEDIIGKKIHLIIQESKDIKEELKNNLANGIVLKGYLKF